MTKQELKDETKNFVDKLDTALVAAKIDEGVQIALKGYTADIAVMICVALDDIKKKTDEADWLAVKFTIMGHLTDFDKILKQQEASAGEVIYEAEEEE